MICIDLMPRQKKSSRILTLQFSKKPSTKNYPPSHPFNPLTPVRAGSSICKLMQCTLRSSTHFLLVCYTVQISVFSLSFIGLLIMRISRFGYNGIQAGDHLNLNNYICVCIEASGRNIGCSLGCRRKPLYLFFFYLWSGFFCCNYVICCNVTVPCPAVCATVHDC